MVWPGKGMALNVLNKFDEAIKAFDKAIEIDSQKSEALRGKGRVLNILNKYDKVIKSI